MKSFIKLSAFVLCLVAVTGCSSVRNYTMQEEENLLSGAGSILVKSAPKESKQVGEPPKTNLDSTARNFELVNIDDLLLPMVSVAPPYSKMKLVSRQTIHGSSIVAMTCRTGSLQRQTNGVPPTFES